MAIAPFIKPIKQSGGTFYSFSSAAEDIGFSFNQDDKKFRFSNFALLNIPDIKRPTLTDKPQNFLQFDSVAGAYGEQDTSDQNKNLAESFQNYCLNLEATLIGQETYDADQYRTVSERVFWKWMKEIGAMRFRNTSTLEKNPSASGLRFAEELTGTSYDRVVEYIGTIDVTNAVKHYTNSFSEVYIHVPTEAGNTPLVLFKSVSDANYSEGMVLQNKSINPVDSEALYGREIDDTHPAGLSVEAHFDSDDAGFVTGDYTLYKYNADAGTYTSGAYWFPTAIANAYFTEPTTFTSIDNDKIRISDGTNVITKLRSKLDGITLDFDTDSYAPIVANASLNSLQDYNNSADATNFDFNAVLLYYDIYDPSDEENTSTTNLFGVLFLDDVENISTGGGQIPRYSKVKPNELTNIQGNGYGFKLNLKFDINSDDAVVVTSVNEYNTYSLELFADALTELQKSASLMEAYTNDIVSLTSAINDMKALVYSQTNVATVMARLEEIETHLTTQTKIFESNDSLVKLINKAYDEILNIYKNYTSVQVSYNLNVIDSGRGTKIDKSVQNKVKIVNTLSSYNKTAQVNVLDDFEQKTDSWEYIHKLGYFSNYIRIHDADGEYKADRDIVIKIDDKDYAWEDGQVLRLVFASDFVLDSNLGDFDFYIYTDSQDKLKTGTKYNKLVIDFTDDDFTSSDNQPIFEIVCLSAKDYSFVVDKIR